MVTLTGCIAGRLTASRRCAPQRAAMRGCESRPPNAVSHGGRLDGGRLDGGGGGGGTAAAADEVRSAARPGPA